MGMQKDCLRRCAGGQYVQFCRVYGRARPAAQRYDKRATLTASIRSFVPAIIVAKLEACGHGQGMWVGFDGSTSTFSQPADGHFHQVGGADKIVSPDFLKQFYAGKGFLCGH